MIIRAILILFIFLSCNEEEKFIHPKPSDLKFSNNQNKLNFVYFKHKDIQKSNKFIKRLLSDDDFQELRNYFHIHLIEIEGPYHYQILDSLNISTLPTSIIYLENGITEVERIRKYKDINHYLSSLNRIVQTDDTIFNLEKNFSSNPNKKVAWKLFEYFTEFNNYKAQKYLKYLLENDTDLNNNRMILSKTRYLTNKSKYQKEIDDWDYKIAEQVIPMRPNNKKVARMALAASIALKNNGHHKKAHSILSTLLSNSTNPEIVDNEKIKTMYAHITKLANR